jgi:hypothetical protein
MHHLWPQEQRGEAYVEFLDGLRRQLWWDDERHCWVAPRCDERAVVQELARLPKRGGEGRERR